ncbi:mechanosensitive ion channel family protein [Sediminitomix flava]|uniref:MscS family membrane protein n=1 Tax=Sediminitomix flava TaxID=379075 RepID=A0A315Z6E5_SEDFL|nr:mechanosensitive ion channel family protein [Sediminitomix flava]PWJ39282.1 MscS family membrane protein [Sediminitomix flava]
MKKRIGYIFLLWGLTFLAQAQFQITPGTSQNTQTEEEDEEKVDLDIFAPDDHRKYQFVKKNGKEFSLSTPYHTIRTHLSFLSSENYEPEISAMTIFMGQYTDQERVDLALKIEAIYDRLGIVIDLNDVSINKDYQYSPNKKSPPQNRYIVSEKYPQIFLEKYGVDWLYSEATCKYIPKLYEKLYPFKTHKLLELSRKIDSDAAKKTYFGIHIWQYFGIALFILLVTVMYRSLRYLFRRAIVSILNYFHFNENIIEPNKRISSPLAYLCVVFIGWLVYPVLQMPAWLTNYLLYPVNIFTFTLLIMAMLRVVRLFSYYVNRSLQKHPTPMDQIPNRMPLAKIIEKLLQFLVIAIGITWMLNAIGIDTTGFVAALSISSVAVAFASQDALKNLIGSVMIFIDRPFQLNDWIVGPDVEGVVEDIGFRTTRIRTFNHSLVSVPNGKLSDYTIDNLGERKYRRFKTYIQITYDTPPDLIDAFVVGLRDIIESHPSTRKDYYHIYLNGFGAHSLDILFNIYFIVPDWDMELKARHDIMLKVIQLAGDLGVRFAFPTQTMHIEAFPEKQGLTPDYPYTRAEFMEQMRKSRNIE